jgi:putative DNA primase/helicase
LEALGVSNTNADTDSKEWKYYDRTGEHLYSVHRFPGKKYRQQAADGTWGLKGVQKTLYRLRELIDASSIGIDDIFFCEGEKDVDALTKRGYVATCNSGGALKKWNPEWNEYFTGAKRVIVLPDNDDPGRKHAEIIKENLSSTCKVEIIKLPVKGIGEDVCDYFKTHDKSEFNALVEQKKWLRAVTVSELIEMDIQAREPLIEPWLCKQDLTMCYAWRGVGKTFFSLSLAASLASGCPFIGWDSVTPTGVLYIDGEMPAYSIKKRVIPIIASLESDLVKPFRIITPDIQDQYIRNLQTTEGQQDVEDLITKDTGMVIIDNLSCLYSGAENDSEYWDMMQTFLLRLRKRGCAVLLIHHANKSGTQRGTSKREDILDNVITLKRPGDYKAEHGARFQISFEKLRNVQHAEEYEVQLEDLPDGTYQWSYKTIKQAREDVIINLHNAGVIDSEIARECGIHKSTVGRIIKKYYGTDETGVR